MRSIIPIRFTLGCAATLCVVTALAADGYEPEPYHPQVRYSAPPETENSSTAEPESANSTVSALPAQTPAEPQAGAALPAAAQAAQRLPPETQADSREVQPQNQSASSPLSLEWLIAGLAGIGLALWATARRRNGSARLPEAAADDQVTGVEHYLRRLAAPQTGVSKYLEKLAAAQPATGVSKYITRHRND
ncbi:hypothetical protein [Methylomonas sp. HYX-M1]|uniref:hypothetical protein n=1 Tax=Methylomonas sp. HYX-M1 TaxID=3139307 RepID=UPI00345BA1BF